MGQACFVDERLDMVAAVTCGANDMGGEFRLIRENLFAAPEMPSAGPEDQDALRKRTETLRYTGPDSDGAEGTLPTGMWESEFQGMPLRLSMEQAAEDRIRLFLSFGEEAKMTFEIPRGTYAPIGEQQWDRSVLSFVGAYGWKAGKLVLSARCLNGPQTLEGAFSAEGDQLIFEGLGVDFPDERCVFRRVSA